MECKIITANALWADERKCIVFAKDCNMFFEFNREMKDVVVLGSLPEEDFYSRGLISNILSYKDEYIFVPLYAKKIWFWNPRKNTWRKVCIKKENTNKKELFMASFIYEDHLYLIGCGYPAILIINLNNLEVQYIEAPFLEIIENNPMGLRDVFFRSDYVVRDDILYVASCICNLVLIFDMKKQTYCLKKVGRGDDGYSGITFDGNDFWLASRNDNILKIWKNYDEVIEYDLEGNTSYAGIACEGGYVYLACRNNKSGLFIIRAEHPIVLEKNINMKSNYSVIKKYGNEIWLANQNGMIECWQGGKIKEEYIYAIKKKDWEKNILKIEKNFVIKENDLFSLDTFINILNKD